MSHSHTLVIGEGQIGQAVVEQALARGGTVTLLRRSDVTTEETTRRYGAGAERITRVRGDASDAGVLATAMRGAGSVHACFHAPYDSRRWRSTLPAAEAAVLDAAAREGIAGVAFPESMYAWAGAAEELREGAPFAPRDEKGRIRAELIAARRAHEARTVSVVAADLLGPTCLGTGAAVACTTVIEPLARGGFPFLPGAPGCEHSLTVVDDLAAAMLLAVEHAEDLARGGEDGVVHAPTDAPRRLSELAAVSAARLGVRRRPLLAIPRLALRAAGVAERTMREIDGIGDLWYRPSRLRPGVLTSEYGLAPTPWDTAVATTVDAARRVAAGSSAARSA